MTAARASWIVPALGLAAAPFLPGLVAKVKALVAGRQGPPMLQLYFDLAKLLRKGAVYSRTTSFVFRAGPVVALAASLVAVFLVPAAGLASPVAFSGDFILLAALLAVGRFFTVAAALDTGSSFEGMGASREVLYAALAEPALLLGLAALARNTGALSLSGILAATSPLAPEVVLVGGSLFLALLCENARVPFDDPNTHLELTMVHEAMVLDHGGPDLALYEYAKALKLWVWCLLVAGVLVPTAMKARLAVVAVPLACLTVGLAIGVVESAMARWRLTRAPDLLAMAAALSAIAFILAAR
jgi:formate hydrogenlyase subunit 4